MPYHSEPAAVRSFTTRAISIPERLTYLQRRHTLGSSQLS